MSDRNTNFRKNIPERIETTTRLFVGGFQARLTNSDLYNYFSQFGRIVKASILYDKKTLKSRSFGFIECFDEATAKEILSKSHSINNREIDVNLAFQKENLKKTRKNWKNLLLKKKLFVTNLPNYATSDLLKTYFQKFGGVRKAYIIRNPIDLKPKGFGYVEFFELETLEKVLKEKRHEILPGIKILCFRYKAKNFQEIEEKDGNEFQENSSEYENWEYGDKLDNFEFFEQNRNLDETKKMDIEIIKNEKTSINNQEVPDFLFERQKSIVEFWQKKQSMNKRKKTLNGNKCLSIKSEEFELRGTKECFYSENNRIEDDLYCEEKDISLKNDAVYSVLKYLDL